MEAGIVNHDSLAASLEQGEVHILASPLPFAFSNAADQAFLREQELHHGKEIIYEPEHQRLDGFRVRSTEQTTRLRHILDASHRAAASYVQAALPHYAADIQPFRTCFHVVEEATRRLRVTARNDLLHVDALHHSRGRRLLRLFVNLNPTDPRIWASSETLAKVLPLHGPKSGLLEGQRDNWSRRLHREVLQLFRADRDLDPRDEFLLQFARYLKHTDEFQEKSPRKIWRFAPGQAWLAFTDSLVHADLRGRWVLDHLYHVPLSCCVYPNLAPASILEQLRATSALAAA